MSVSKSPLIVIIKPSRPSFTFKDVKTGDLFIHENRVYLKAAHEPIGSVYQGIAVGNKGMSRDFSRETAVKHVKSIEVTAEA